MTRSMKYFPLTPNNKFGSNRIDLISIKIKNTIHGCIIQVPTVT